VRTLEGSAGIIVKHVNQRAGARSRMSGTVAPGIRPVYTAVSANGKPALLVSVNRQSRQQHRARSLRKCTRKWRRSARRCRPACEMRPVLRPIEHRPGVYCSCRDAIIIGLFLAGLTIWLFLRDWGTALMTGLVVPVTMVITFIVMKASARASTDDARRLAAAVGLVIDDKIVVVENIVLHRDSGEGPLQARPVRSRS